MAKKSMGEKFSDWIGGYRSRPDDEYYDEDFYEDEEEIFDDDPKPKSYVRQDEYVNSYGGLDEEDEDDEEVSRFFRQKERASRKGRATSGRDYREDRSREERTVNQNRSGPKIYPMNRGGASSIKIESPTRFDGTTKSIIDEIRSGASLVVNLEQVSRQDFIRFVDFLAGAVYIMDSNMQYVNERILIIAPKNVTVAGGESREVYEVEPMASVY